MTNQRLYAFIYSFLIALFLCPFTLYGAINRLHFTLPDNWTVSQNRRHYRLILHSERMATATIRTLPLDTPLTINGLQQMRIRHTYEGWTLLFSRPQSPAYAQEAGVEEAALSVYQKRIVTTNFQFKKYLASDYYYLTPSAAYILTISAEQAHWPQIQEAVSDLNQSFWVGETASRPAADPPLSLEWQQPHANPRHLNYLPVSIGWPQLRSPRWTTHLPHRNPQTVPLPPVYNTSALFYVDYDRLTALHRRSGKILWKTLLPSPSTIPLTYAHGILYVSQPGRLLALSANHGQTLYQLPLSLLTAPVITRRYLLAVDSNTLHAYYADSGMPVWSQPLDSPPRSLSGTETYSLVQTAHSIHVFDTQTGTPQWTRSIQPSHHLSPLLAKTHVVFTTINANNPANQTIRVHTLRTGQPVQTRSFPHIQAMASDGLFLYVIAEQSLIKLALPSLKPQWTAPLPITNAHETTLALTTDTVLLLQNGKPSAFDPQTGAPLVNAALSENLPLWLFTLLPTEKGAFSMFAYQTSIGFTYYR